MRAADGFSTRRVGGFAAALWLMAGSWFALGAQEVDKVAVIDVRRILQESQAGREALETLRALQESKAAEMAELEAPAVQLQEKLEQGRLSLSEEKQEEMERELQSMLIGLQRAEDDARRVLEQRQVEELEAIEARLMPLVGQIGEELGYTLIFNKFEDSGLLYAASRADITDVVMERLDSLPDEE